MGLIFGNDVNLPAATQTGTTNRFASGTDAPGRTAPAAAASQPLHTGKFRLQQQDIDLLCALSAMQIRFGQPQEAIAYLMMIRQIDPANKKALRLLAASLIKLNRWQEAELVLDELERVQSCPSPRSQLYRAIVCFKTDRIAEAKRAFGNFCNIRMTRNG